MSNIIIDNSIEEFRPFAKIARLSRDMVITEKIDGTNGCVAIDDDGNIRAGSRNRWITTENDNFGFARWVEENKAELCKLGPGRHFGEWWGQGINRGYGLHEKRFSLFNIHKWSDNPERPSCCRVVPVLDKGIFSITSATYMLDMLIKNGSQAVPGYMKPEGIVIYHKASNQLFKKTIENDEVPKGKVKNG